MKLTLRLSSLVLGLGLMVAPSFGQTADRDGREQAPDLLTGPSTHPATAEGVEALALQAVRVGDFQKTADLLKAAAAMAPQDELIQQMSAWTADYEIQKDHFDAERKDQFDKAVTNIHILVDHHMDDFAIDEAESAYTLAFDKDAFRKEPWINDLFTRASTTADKDEDTGLWLKALRIYSDLAALDPTSPVWKDKLKMATRRVRLVMVYTPARLKTLQDDEAKDRKAANALLPVTTDATQGAATMPSLNVASTQPEDLSVSDVPADVDWHDVVKGVRYDMLRDALVLADREYYRTVDYATLLEGGLIGLRTVATTPGLEDAFPGLANDDNRKQFIAAVDSCMDSAKNAVPAEQEDVMDQSMDRLRDLNKTTINLPEEVFVSEFADGAFGQLDPFSTMIWPYETPDFQKMTKGEFGGVGIQIETDIDGNLKVVTPLEDSPAFRAGVKAGYVITKIDGKKAMRMPLDVAVKLITGEVGTNVRLTMRDRIGNVSDFNLKREEIKVESIKGYSHKSGGGWDYMIDPVQKIGYVRLLSFSESTSDDLDKALAALKDDGAKSMILDLRYDPGGLLQAATEVVNKFISDGVIVSTHADRETSNQPTIKMADEKGKLTDLPMIVLVNQYSASASEIVSGALKDDHRAMLVGERTFGKGSVQMLYKLDSPELAFLKLTTAHYYLPSGRCIHREENSTTWGVDPDVTVEMTPAQMQTVIDARTDLDVLPETEQAATQPSTEAAKKDPISVDPQLSAALTILRLELNGAQL